MRSAMGLIAGPDNPPVMFVSPGLRVSESIAMARNVLTRLTASAYALIYPSFFEGFGVPVLEAMECEVPVITSTGSSMQEIAGDAALYADPGNYIELADKMMHLYKDEMLRASLLQKASTVVSQYTWDKTARLLWQAIQKAIV